MSAEDKAGPTTDAPFRLGWAAVPGGWEYWLGGFVHPGEGGFYARPHYRDEMPIVFPTVELAMAAAELGYDPRWANPEHEAPLARSTVDDLDITAWLSPLVTPSDRKRLQALKRVPMSQWWDDWHLSTWFDERFERALWNEEARAAQVHARLVALGAKSACYLIDPHDYLRDVARMFDLRGALQLLDAEPGAWDALLLCLPGKLAFYQTHHGDRVIVSRPD